MKSDPTGPQRFGRSWSDGPDGGGPHRSTNTAVLRFDGTGCWQQHLLVFRAIMKSSGWSPDKGGLTVVCTPRWGGAANLLELSGETWVASALMEELTADLLPAGSNVDLIVESHQDATLATVREWIQSGVTPTWAECAGFSPELCC